MHNKSSILSKEQKDQERGECLATEENKVHSPLLVTEGHWLLTLSPLNFVCPSCRKNITNYLSPKSVTMTQLVI